MHVLHNDFNGSLISVSNFEMYRKTSSGRLLSSLRFRLFTVSLKCKHRDIKNSFCLKMIFTICVKLYYTALQAVIFLVFIYLFIVHVSGMQNCVLCYISKHFRQLLTTIFNLLIGQLSNNDECLLPHAVFGR